MSILPRLSIPALVEGHWHQDDLDLEAEREYRAEQGRRYAADPTEAESAWWDALARELADDQGPDDAHYDAWYADSLAQDRLDAGFCC